MSGASTAVKFKTMAALFSRSSFFSLLRTSIGKNCSLAPIVPQVLIPAVFALLLAPAVVADDDVPREANKLKEIQEIIERQGLEIPDRFPSHATVEDIRRFRRDCGQFLEDLKVGRNIEVIEPILRTDDPNHPNLVRYQSACRDTKSTEANYRDLSDIGTHAFRLYHLEAKGNTKNPPEDILYAEGNPQLFGNGTYRRVDLKQCTIKSFGHPCCSTTLTPQDTRTAVTNVNTIIRYQGSFYVLDMEGEKIKGEKDFRYGINIRWALGAGAQYQCRFARPY